MSFKKNDLQTQLIKTFLGVIFYSQEKKNKKYSDSAINYIAIKYLTALFWNNKR